MITPDLITQLTPSAEAYYFWSIIVGLLLALCACFIIAVLIMSIGEWLNGGAFLATFSYCWNNL